jgi:hypothetical protein
MRVKRVTVASLRRPSSSLRRSPTQSRSTHPERDAPIRKLHSSRMMASHRVWGYADAVARPTTAVNSARVPRMSHVIATS